MSRLIRTVLLAVFIPTMLVLVFAIFPVVVFLRLSEAAWDVADTMVDKLDRYAMRDKR
jgi:hypothetical protein